MISRLIVTRLSKFGSREQEARRNVEGRVIKLFRNVSPAGVLDRFLCVIRQKK